MKHILIIFASLIIGTSASASDIARATISQAIDVIQFDFTDDGLTDRAVLVEDEPPYARLVVFSAGKDGLDQGTVLKEEIWSGLVFGQVAQLKTVGRNSLLVSSKNESIGRNRWTQRLTIAYRKGAYRVVGFTYDYYDTLNPDNNGMCDVNYLNGKADIKINQAPSAMEHRFRAVSITDWSIDHVPDACFGG
jgi:hypothetical protein